MAKPQLWFIPTSPRSPEKLRPELEVLAAGFEGAVWDEAAQARYADALIAAGPYEGRGGVEANRAQAGRERVHRAPRALGFVIAKTGGTLRLTGAGRALLAGHDEADLFLHQLLKLQFPSVWHNEDHYLANFNIKPFRAVLALLLGIETVSQFELQTFILPMTWDDEVDTVAKSILLFRKKLAKRAPGLPRRQFEEQTRIERYLDVYAEDIAAGMPLREQKGRPASLDRFIATKIRNARDYADATIRYFRATGILSHSGVRTLRLLPERRPDVERILEVVPSEPEEYGDEAAFLEYLGNPDLPVLPLDDPVVVRGRLTALVGDIPDHVRAALEMQLPDVATAPVEELKIAFSRLESAAEQDALGRFFAELAGRDVIDDLVSMFKSCRSREVLEPSLFLEWNTARMLAMLDDTEELRPNLRMDRFGQPVSYAPGNMADIEVDYRRFRLLTEVTLATGATQHAAEGEPVDRHVGLFQRRTQEAGDHRPVFGLFIAGRLAPTVVQHFYAQFGTKIRGYGGAVRIIPLDIDDVVAMLEATRNNLPTSEEDLYAVFARAALLHTESMDEEEWHTRVRELVRRGIGAARRPAATAPRRAAREQRRGEDG